MSSDTSTIVLRTSLHVLTCQLCSSGVNSGNEKKMVLHPCHLTLSRYLRQGYEFDPPFNEKDKSSESQKGSKKEKSTWSGLYTKMCILFPYLWPKGKLGLQVRVLACVVLVLSLRGINVLVPRLNKTIIDGLAAEKPNFPYDTILLYSLVTLLQGGMGRQGGLVTSLKNILWIR